MSTSDSVQRGGRTPDELASQVRFLEAEVTDLRRGSARAPPARAGWSSGSPTPSARWPRLTSQNERLAETLREARDQIMKLKEEVDRLAQPPAGFGTFLTRNEDDSIDVFTGGRKLRVNVSPERRPRRAAPWPGGDAQRGAQRRRRPRVRGGRRGGDVQGAARRRRPGPGHRQRRRGARRPPRGAAAPRQIRGRRLAAARRPRGLRLREGARSPRSRSWSSKRSRTSTTATSAASAARSRRSATPSSCPTCTPSSSRSTSSSRRRACCSTARPAAARR